MNVFVGKASRITRTLTIVAVLGISTLSYSAPAFADPQLTVQQEWKAHPNLVKAVRAMQGAMADLERAPYDFGGNKGQAINDMKAGIHSLKKAIFYRLHMDDEAIDKAQVQ